MIRSTLLAATLIFLPGVAAAQSQGADDAQAKPTAPPVPPTLTGEWGGLRTTLRDAGIDLTVNYTSELAANVSGGTRHLATETGQFSFGATVDMARLVGIPGGTLTASISDRRGDNLTDRAGIGALLQIQEVYGRGQTWRLSEFSYSQKLGGGIDLKLGRLPMGADFASFPCDFENLTFCGNPVGNLVGGYWFNYPLAVWGARVRKTQGDFYVMAGVYEDNPNNNRNRFIFLENGATGVTAPAELGWTPRFRGLPGTYKVGGWYNSSRGADVLDGTNGQPFGLTGSDPAQRRGRYGGWMLVQQQLTGRSTNGPGGPVATHGLSVFLNLTQADRRTTRIDNQIAGGLTFLGPLGGRPMDDIGFAVGRNHVNSRAAWAELLAAPGSAHVDCEYVSELYYSLHARPWLIVRPNLQYIVHPGGFHQATDVVVLGTKTSITF